MGQNFTIFDLGIRMIFCYVLVSDVTIFYVYMRLVEGHSGMTAVLAYGVTDIEQTQV